MKIKPLKQKDDSACGPACIKMAAEYFQIPIKLTAIGKISQYIKKDGLTNQDLINTFEYFNFKVRSKLNTTWGNLKQSNKKNNVVIISWMKKGYLGHFSVVEKITDKYIVIVDPAEGKTCKIKKIIFLRLWMNYNDMWYPKKNTDIELRWMGVVSKKHIKKTRNS